MASYLKESYITGNADFTSKVQSVKDRLNAQIPSSLRLPSSTLANLPLDVTRIPTTCGLLSSSELAITDLDATTVCKRIASGELTAVEAVTAFGKRAAIAHQVTNCLTDFFLEEGIAQARELDSYYQESGKVVGPLHGLPISIKDHMPIKGRWASGGFIANLEVSENDSHMINILRQLGAGKPDCALNSRITTVFYVKTNQPQGIMCLETTSFYGRTFNPYNSNLTPGGSSGGEAALIAMKGSCMGVGTDVGGSIRGPSANVGIYGIRPSSLTMPTGGYICNTEWSMPGQEGIICSTGPMCRSAQDMSTFIHAVSATKPNLLDPSLLPISFDLPDLSNKKLRVGIMMHDGCVTPHPPMLRALQLAKEKLSAASNIELVEYRAFEHRAGLELAHRLYFEDGGRTIRKLLGEGGEDVSPLVEWVSGPTWAKEHTAVEMWNLHAQRDMFLRAYSDYWNKSGCDVLVCPPTPGTAGRHNTSKYWSYTAIWNLLDYPGAVFPSGLYVDPAIDVIPQGFSPLSDEDSTNHAIYDPEIYVGAPISLQVIAKRFNDGFLLAAQRIIEDIIKA
ncbi:hypothetical protein HYDPIDRAFT_87857 [Hydnomerulius pinastri MD-312]|nr:hypothetical protein HYDPIDRAFT_87857 [Hydnomerulius pinastri MD-312]